MYSENNIKKTSRRVTDLRQYNSLGEYCDPHTASSVFLIFTTQLYNHIV